MFVQKVYTGTVTYIPEWNGNRDREGDQRIEVEFEPLSKADMDDYHRQITMFQKKGRSRKEEGLSSNQAAIQRRIFIDRMKKVRNFGLDFNDGKPAREPSSFAEMYDYADPELTEEILDAMQNNARLEEGRKKD